MDEVVNYVHAMNRGLARLAELPVSVRLIREIHERLMRGVRGGRLTPGELRRSQNWIGPGGAGIADALFVPPPAEVVPEAELGILREITGNARKGFGRCGELEHDGKAESERLERIETRSVD